MFWPIFFCAIWFSYVNEYMKDHWFSYIDDTFTLFDSENTATQFFHYLNNCHANIKFTIEFGDNSTNPFLDILNKRHSHTFSTSIYRKKTFIALNKMGLLHSEEIHSKTHLNSHFLLFPNLFLTFSFVLLFKWTEKLFVAKWIPYWCYQLQHQWCSEQAAKQS